MAAIISEGGNQRSRKPWRRKKISTNVDLTPMVDLGFLLITFFIFTTAMTTPRAIKLYLPAGETASLATGESTVLTIIPMGQNKVFYYHGNLISALSKNLYGTTGFARDGIGNIIRQKQQALNKRHDFSAKDLMLIIKPSAEARYQNIVDALDEVTINNVKHYAFTTLEPAEKFSLKQLVVN